MNNAVVLDFASYRQKRLNNESSSLSVSEELAVEIKKLIGRLRSYKSIPSYQLTSTLVIASESEAT